METEAINWLLLTALLLGWYFAQSMGPKSPRECPMCHGKGKTETHHADAVEIRTGVWNAAEWTTERKCHICDGHGMAREVKRETDSTGHLTVYYEPVPREGSGK